MPPKSTPAVTPVEPTPAPPAPPALVQRWYRHRETGERVDAEAPPSGGSWSVDPATGEMTRTED